MYPISQERVLWIEGRIFLLGRMINEISTRQARYQTRPQYAQQHHPVLMEMIAEQLKLNVEKNCIEEMLADDAEEAERRDMARTLAST